jgi:hypothetical protein
VTAGGVQDGRGAEAEAAHAGAVDVIARLLAHVERAGERVRRIGDL